VKKYLEGVGRGVLRFWGLRYRQPRSNFDDFWDFYAVSISGGVDIIYAGWWVYGRIFDRCGIDLVLLEGLLGVWSVDGLRVGVYKFVGVMSLLGLSIDGVSCDFVGLFICYVMFWDMSFVMFLLL